jgi:hypothetical protein
MEQIGFPEESQEYFKTLYHKVIDNSKYNRQMNEFVDKYMKDETEEAYAGVDRLAGNLSVHNYSMSMLLLLLCAEPLFQNYQEKEIPETIFWDTMKDLYCKLMECHQVYGIWGTFVRSWYPGFYQMTRFTLGRMQYEYAAFELEEYKLQDYVIKKGDKVINMHIPSSGSFSREIRFDSYKKAYEFYKNNFGGKPIPMVCDSWLLYPEHMDFLPDYLNIRCFMEDFSYIEGNVKEEFEDAWRVFGKDYKKAPKDLPQDTTLQKAYANHLMKGGKTGSGYGVFLFDGEKILK